MISGLIQKLIAGRCIEPRELEQALDRIMGGEVEPAQTAGLLVVLATRPTDAGMLAAGARALRAHCVAVDSPSSPVIDTCGTGGDGAGTFNISTAAAFVLAAAGVKVAKHGNRAVSSSVGSADVLEAAGCHLQQTPECARELLNDFGFVFLFAPAYHPAMKHVAPVRRALGVRTIFNLLGPLTNPANADCQLIGVFDPQMTRTMATALRELGSRSALVVHCAGVDEIGLHDVTKGHRLRDGRIEPFRLSPEDVGLARVPLARLAGGDADANLETVRATLAGAPGPASDVVALNAAAAFEVAGVVPDLQAGLERARAAMESGDALRALDRYVEASARHAGPSR